MPSLVETLKERLGPGLESLGDKMAQNRRYTELPESLREVEKERDDLRAKAHEAVKKSRQV